MAATIPRSYIENYSRTLNIANEHARRELVAALQKIDYAQPIANIRDAVIAIMQRACGASTTLAARLAAEFYDGLRVRMVGQRMGTVAATMRDPAATDGAIRAFVQILVDGGDPEEFIKQCAGRLDYESRKAANECMAENAKADIRKPKWARVPTGPETCDYCVTLASRGFVYGSAELASHSHENCDCRVVPGWGDKPNVELFNPEEYFEQVLRFMSKGSKKHTDSVVEDSVDSDATVSAARFSGLGDMKRHLETATDLDELYIRAEEVMQDYKAHYDDGTPSAQSMLDTLTRTAIAMRRKLV